MLKGKDSKPTGGPKKKVHIISPKPEENEPFETSADAPTTTEPSAIPNVPLTILTTSSTPTTPATPATPTITTTSTTSTTPTMLTTPTSQTTTESSASSDEKKLSPRELFMRKPKKKKRKKKKEPEEPFVRAGGRYSEFNIMAKNIALAADRQPLPVEEKDSALEDLNLPLGRRDSAYWELDILPGVEKVQSEDLLNWEKMAELIQKENKRMRKKISPELRNVPFGLRQAENIVIKRPKKTFYRRARVDWPYDVPKRIFKRSGKRGQKSGRKKSPGASSKSSRATRKTKSVKPLRARLSRSATTQGSDYTRTTSGTARRSSETTERSPWSAGWSSDTTSRTYTASERTPASTWGSTPVGSDKRMKRKKSVAVWRSPSVELRGSADISVTSARKVVRMLQKHPGSSLDLSNMWQSYISTCERARTRRQIKVPAEWVSPISKMFRMSRKKRLALVRKMEEITQRVKNMFSGRYDSAIFGTSEKNISEHFQTESLSDSTVEDVTDAYYKLVGTNLKKRKQESILKLRKPKRITEPRPTWRNTIFPRHSDNRSLLISAGIMQILREKRTLNRIRIANEKEDIERYGKRYVLQIMKPAPLSKKEKSGYGMRMVRDFNLRPESLVFKPSFLTSRIKYSLLIDDEENEDLRHSSMKVDEKLERLSTISLRTSEEDRLSVSSVVEGGMKPRLSQMTEEEILALPAIELARLGVLREKPPPQPRETPTGKSKIKGFGPMHKIPVPRVVRYTTVRTTTAEMDRIAKMNLAARKKLVTRKKRLPPKKPKKGLPIDTPIAARSSVQGPQANQARGSPFRASTVHGSTSPANKPRVSMAREGTPGQNRAPGSKLEDSIHRGSKPQGSTLRGSKPHGSILRGSKPQERILRGSKPQVSIHLGSKPQESIPRGSKPPEIKPLGSKPQENIRRGSIPRGSVPQESKPQESKLRTSKPQENIPRESIPRGSIPRGSIPRGSIPRGSIAQESIPRVGIPRVRMREDSLYRDSIPRGDMPRRSIPRGSIPRDSIRRESMPRSILRRSSLRASSGYIIDEGSDSDLDLSDTELYESSSMLLDSDYLNETRLSTDSRMRDSRLGSKVMAADIHRRRRIARRRRFASTYIMDSDTYLDFSNTLAELVTNPLQTLGPPIEEPSQESITSIPRGSEFLPDGRRVSLAAGQRRASSAVKRPSAMKSGTGNASDRRISWSAPQNYFAQMQESIEPHKTEEVLKEDLDVPADWFNLEAAEKAACLIYRPPWRNARYTPRKRPVRKNIEPGIKEGLASKLHARRISGILSTLPPMIQQGPSTLTPTKKRPVPEWKKSQQKHRGSIAPAFSPTPKAKARRTTKRGLENKIVALRRSQSRGSVEVSPALLMTGLYQKSGRRNAMCINRSSRTIRSSLLVSGQRATADSVEEDIFTGPERRPLLHGQYLFGKKIGVGAHGTVRIGENMFREEPVALKMEYMRLRKFHLRHEHSIYKTIGRTNGFPEIFAYEPAVKKKYNVLAMELLGPSLHELYLKMTKFSLKTVLQVVNQVLRRVEVIHEKGIVHRDITPENFLVGQLGTRRERLIYMVDFGLAKMFRNKARKHIPYKSCGGVCPTAKFASINSQLGRELSRRDDLEACGYMFVFFARGFLPWEKLDIENPKQKFQKICEMKQAISAEELCEGLPIEFTWYMDYIRKLKFPEDPDYSLLRNLFSELYYRCGYFNRTHFDWTDLLRRESVFQQFRPMRTSSRPRQSIVPFYV